MNIVEIIETKRDGGRLDEDQIRWFIDAYVHDDVAEEQAAALCMAIFFRGLDDTELAIWTDAMIRSGIRLDLSSLRAPTVDKHSTGGVGDKISLILTPLMAACGAAVPQLSGRGLGHTGGTLDKLESIAGWHCDLSPERFIKQLDEVGIAIVSAGPELAPADRKLYALRDITATVASIPLIASSIMSKKIAEGTSALVLDVKFGSGASLTDPEQGRELASKMVTLGNAHGVATRALLTNMDQPLGRAAGNANEVRESLEVLAGGGPSDVVELTLALAGEMCDMAQIDVDPSAVLASGAAMDRWNAMVRAQDGDPDAPLPKPQHTEPITVNEGGFIARIDARAVGDAARISGAGRTGPGQQIDAAAGIDLALIAGDRVDAGDTFAWISANSADQIEDARTVLAHAVTISPVPPVPQPLIADRITE
jgi:thymidine phosphorylase